MQTFIIPKSHHLVDDCGISIPYDELIVKKILRNNYEIYFFSHAYRYGILSHEIC